MIKSELVTRLQLQNPHLLQRDVEGVMNAFVDEIANAMRDGNRVELRGFGAFSVRVREARVGRNPRTGDPVSVEQKAAPFFRTGKEMRDRINKAAQQRSTRHGRTKAEEDPEEGTYRRAAE